MKNFCKKLKEIVTEIIKNENKSNATINRSRQKIIL